MKTKLGVSVALLGTAAYFFALVGGWIPTVLVVGYILLFETNDWLKMSAIKAISIMVLFSIISSVIGLIPNAITLLDNVFSIFNGNFSLSFVSKIIILINTILTIAQKLLLLALGFTALHQGSVSFGVIDKLIAKHLIKD